LCEGGAKGPDDCPQASEVRCSKCGCTWEATDVYRPGKCPECGCDVFHINRCANCGLDELENARATSAAGRMLNRTLELEFMAREFRLGWDEIPADEALGLRLLKEERGRHQQDKIDEAERERSAARSRDRNG